MNIIHVWLTEHDVNGIAEAHGIDPAVALDRAIEWGKHIEQTVSTIANEQLESVIVSGSP